MRWRFPPLMLAVAALVPASLPSCVTTERIASGLASPLFATAARGETGQLFIVERAGTVRRWNLSTGTNTVFLDISTLVGSGGERGLLGLAFHPNYDTNGLLYINYSATNGDSVIAEYQRQTGNPAAADPSSARILLTVAQPQDNHKGGWLGFGPDGYLYASFGDGGGSYDQDTGHTADIGNAQDLTDNLLGKILRLDVGPGKDDFPQDSNRNYAIPPTNPFVGVTGDDEIWAYGLRNPFRCSFDRLMGDFWIGDVGQGAREEVDFQAASSSGGENYGWRLREGSIQTPASVGGPKPVDNEDPIYDYAHGSGQFQGNCVTGGYVYRGPVTELRGKYFFADFSKQKVWSITRNGTTYTELTDWTSQFRPLTGSINLVASFGEDGDGNLYIVDLDGEIFRVTRKSLFGSTVSAVTRLFAGNDESSR